MTTIEKIKNLGWNINSNRECWEDENYLYFSTGNDCTDYTVQINKETEQYRTCGNGAGCFWTEWKD